MCAEFVFNAVQSLGILGEKAGYFSDGAARLCTYKKIYVMYAIYTQTYIHMMRILEYKEHHLMSMFLYIPKGNRSNSTFQVF